MGGSEVGVSGGVDPVNPEADTGDVCGWLIPLRNGLSNHAGANFEMVELRDSL